MTPSDLRSVIENSKKSCWLKLILEDYPIRWRYAHKYFTPVKLNRGRALIAVIAGLTTVDGT